MVSPAVGATVPLLIDRKSGKVHWDVKNPELNLSASLKAHEVAEQAKFDKFKTLGDLAVGRPAGRPIV